MQELSHRCHHFSGKSYTLGKQEGILDACKAQPIRDVDRCRCLLAVRCVFPELQAAYLMILRLTLALTVGALLSSCAYPFGHSSYGNYYGSRGGDAAAPRTYVPREVQRERSMF